MDSEQARTQVTVKASNGFPYSCLDRDAVDHFPQPANNYISTATYLSLLCDPSILFIFHKAENFVASLFFMCTKNRAGKEAPSQLSYSLGQLESPARPLSLDDKLIPDHKGNREKQSNCCYKNKA